MPDAVVYWDSSAILSVLFKDSHGVKAKAIAGRDGVHLLSTLACAEVSAVISRLRRERLLTDAATLSSFDRLSTGPWRRVLISPNWSLFQELATKHPLRGADLWHLSAAIALRADLGDLCLATYDNRLKAAAEAEGLTV